MAKAKTKKEIDKDLMYSKLMPSISRPDEDEETEEAVLAAQAAPSLPEPDDGSLSQLRSKLFGEQSTFQASGDKPIILMNLMEDAVMSKLDDAFSKFNCCRCDRCRKDVVAIALNKLPTKYMVGSTAQLERKKLEIPSKEISAALVQAILKVRANPRH